jgi:hypothetical protein
VGSQAGCLTRLSGCLHPRELFLRQWEIGCGCEAGAGQAAYAKIASAVVLSLSWTRTRHFVVACGSFRRPAPNPLHSPACTPASTRRRANPRGHAGQFGIAPARVCSTLRWRKADSSVSPALNERRLSTTRICYGFFPLHQQKPRNPTIAVGAVGIAAVRRRFIEMRQRQPGAQQQRHIPAKRSMPVFDPDAPLANPFRPFVEVMVDAEAQMPARVRKPFRIERRLKPRKRSNPRGSRQSGRRGRPICREVRMRRSCPYRPPVQSSCG